MNYCRYICITALFLYSSFFFISCDIEDLARTLKEMKDKVDEISKTETCSPSFNSTANNPDFSQGTDPLYSQQWHLSNTGQTAFAVNPASVGVDLNLPMGVSGKGVIVNVIDDGIEWTHEDLVNNIITSDSKHFLNLQGDCIVENEKGASHGTSVAGLIAAEQGNGLGGRGVAPNTEIISHNYLAVEQSLANFIMSLTASADIINQSSGFKNMADMLISDNTVNTYKDVVNRLRGRKGAIAIKSAGNSFQKIEGVICSEYFQIPTVDTMPIGISAPLVLGLANPNQLTVTCQNANMDPNNTLPYNIVVAAVNAQGVKSSYSTAGSAILVSGFGGEGGSQRPAMITTDFTGCQRGTSSTRGTQYKRGIPDGSGDTNCNYTKIFNGTSSAAPTVAGVVALMLETNPDLTWRDVRHILVHTSRKIDVSRDVAVLVTSDNVDIKDATAELGWQTNFVGHEFHNWYGFGLVDASAAVQMAKIHKTDSFGELKKLRVVETLITNATIPDASASGLTNQATITEDITVEAVQIRINITHPHTSDLGIFLTSPSGTQSLLLNFANVFRDDDNLDIVLASQAFYGENAIGMWEVKVIDYIGRNTIAKEMLNVGELNSWELIIYGHTP